MAKKRAASVWRKSPGDLVALFYGALLDDPRVERRQMFGYPCAFVGGNLFTGLHQESVIVRLAEGDRLAASRERTCSNRCPGGRCANTSPCRKRRSRAGQNSRPGCGARSAMPLHCPQKQRNLLERLNRPRGEHPVASLPDAGRIQSFPTSFAARRRSPLRSFAKLCPRYPTIRIALAPRPATMRIIVSRPLHNIGTRSRDAERVTLVDNVQDAPDDEHGRQRAFLRPATKVHDARPHTSPCSWLLHSLCIEVGITSLRHRARCHGLFRCQA